MTKAQEKKLAKKIKDVVGESFIDTDQFVIDDLVDWLSISDFIKKELQDEVKDNGSFNWQTMTKLAMARKAVESNLKLLGISRSERLKIKFAEKGKEGFDLSKFLNEN